MKVDRHDIEWCRAHLQLCQRLAEGCHWTPLPFFVARARRTFDRRLPQEAYWAAAEAEGVAARSHPGAPELWLDPFSAWAVLAAANERRGRTLFYGFHPMERDERAQVWHRLRKAVRLLGQLAPPGSGLDEGA